MGIIYTKWIYISFSVPGAWFSWLQCLQAKVSSEEWAIFSFCNFSQIQIWKFLVFSGLWHPSTLSEPAWNQPDDLRHERMVLHYQYVYVEWFEGSFFIHRFVSFSGLATDPPLSATTALFTPRTTETQTGWSDTGKEKGRTSPKCSLVNRSSTNIIYINWKYKQDDTVSGLSTYGRGFMVANGQAVAPTRPGRHTRESG